MPFKTAAAEADKKAPPSAEAIAMIEDSMSEVYLLAKWQGGRVGRYENYSKSFQQVLAFLRQVATAALGPPEALNVLAAARAALSSGIAAGDVPPSLLRSLQTCSSIRQEAAAAHADRDTPAKPCPCGAAHARVQKLFSTAHAVLSGGTVAAVGAGDDVVMSEEELAGSASHAFGAILFLLDFDETLSSVAAIWTQYKHGEVGLVRATIATNECVEFTKELSAALVRKSPHLNTLEMVVTEIYMQPSGESSQKSAPYSNCYMQ